MADISAKQRELTMLRSTEQTLKKQLDVAQDKLSRLSRQQVLKREGTTRTIEELQQAISTVRKDKVAHQALVRVVKSE